MIVEYLRYRIEPDRQADFIADWGRASAPLHASPHALGFSLCRCVEDPAEFIIRIDWTSAEDHMQRFRGSTEFRAFFAHVKAYVGDIAEMRHYEPLLSGPPPQD